MGFAEAVINSEFYFLQLKIKPKILKKRVDVYKKIDWCISINNKIELLGINFSREKFLELPIYPLFYDQNINKKRKRQLFVSLGFWQVHEFSRPAPHHPQPVYIMYELNQARTDDVCSREHCWLQSALSLFVHHVVIYILHHDVIMTILAGDSWLLSSTC